MLTGKALCETLMTELNDMGLPGMSATLDGMYRSPDFIHLDPLMAIANLVEPEYQKKMTKRIQSRLRGAHLGKWIQVKLPLHHTGQTVYAAPQVRIAAGNVDLIRSAEIL